MKNLPVKKISEAEQLKMAQDLEGFPRFVPDVFIGTVEPNFFCRAWNSKRLKYCHQRAGHNTDHPHEGRCAWHGKGGILKHGRYSKVTRTSLRNHLERIKAEDRDRTDLTEEVDMLRAVAADFVERYEELVEALLAWNRHEFVDAAKTQRRARPLVIPDIASVSKLLIDAATVADKMHAQEHRDSIAKRDFFRVQDAMASAVANRINESVRDPGQAKTIISQISDDWSEIRL